MELQSGGVDSVSHAIRRITRQMLPLVLGLGVLQLNIFIDWLIASYPTWIGPEIFGFKYPLEQGAMSSLAYSQRLYEFPLGVFGIAIATAIFPELVRTAPLPTTPLTSVLPRKPNKYRSRRRPSVNAPFDPLSLIHI